MSESYDWEVHDVTHDHRFCADENHPGEFGPMPEAQARALEASNPKGYRACRIRPAS